MFCRDTPILLRQKSVYDGRNNLLEAQHYVRHEALDWPPDSDFESSSVAMDSNVNIFRTHLLMDPKSSTSAFCLTYSPGQTQFELNDNRVDAGRAIESTSSKCQWDNCGHKFESQPVTSRMVAVHFKQKHSEVLDRRIKTKCKWCPACSNTCDMESTSIVKHVSNCHLGADKSWCGYCGAILSTKNALKRHQLQSQTCRRQSYQTVRAIFLHTTDNDLMRFCVKNLQSQSTQASDDLPLSP